MNQHYHKPARNQAPLAEAKRLLPLPQLMEKIGDGAHAKKSAFCPFHENTHTAAFSVYKRPDGAWRWKCFAGCGHGDGVTYLEKRFGLSPRDAIARYCREAGLNCAPTVARPHQANARPKPVFPDFHKGRMADLNQLASLRKISREGLEWASERGLLWFATLKDFPAWIVADSARLGAQARRLDGQGWEHLDGRPKAWTLFGSWASWPIGIREARPFPAIALCEGGPDFLAAHYLALWEQASHYTKRDVQCVPVAMLGSSQRIHPDALPMFTSKRVRIFGHADEAGRRAARCWAEQLATVDVQADAFDFSGLERADGQPAKDVNDCLFLNADGFGQTERILP
jgi:hypothetical protein